VPALGLPAVAASGKRRSDTRGATCNLQKLRTTFESNSVPGHQYRHPERSPATAGLLSSNNGFGSICVQSGLYLLVTPAREGSSGVCRNAERSSLTGSNARWMSKRSGSRRSGKGNRWHLKLGVPFRTTPEFWLNALARVDLYRAASRATGDTAEKSPRALHRSRNTQRFARGICPGLTQSAGPSSFSGAGRIRR
jgi:hypothetical protein